MSARGPDGAGLWISNKGNIGLAHRRLSIIDLSESGSQPMPARQGRLQIVFNGEIYNYRFLRNALEKKGYSFSSNSDTEVILNLYAEKGLELVHDLRGMYAFALWDEDRQGLFLARDPFGIKPLYFHDDGRAFRCASQVKALLAGGGFEPQLEPAGHAGFFLWGSVPEPYTLYKNVFALPAGHTLWVDSQGARPPHKFFDVADEFANAPSPSTSVEEDIALLRSALQDSIRRHLIADVPVGVFLSAGLDSSVIAALSTETTPLIQTATLGFKEYENLAMDEVPLARKIAEHYGCRHSVSYITKSDFESERERFLAAMDQPSVDGVNSYFISRAAAQAGLKVALSGLGGDELLGGYPSFRGIPRLVPLARFPAALPGFGKMFRLFSASFLKRMTSPKYAGLFEYGGTYGGAYLLRRSLFMPWELPDVMDADMAREGWNTLQSVLRMDDMLAGIRGSHARISMLELTHYMRNTLLRDSDWASMAHSLEVRVPLMDIDLFRALLPILTRENVTLSKRDMAQAPVKPLPSEVTNRPKTGFAIPVRQWLESDAQDSRLRGLRGWALQVYQSFGYSHEMHDARRKRVLALVSDAFGSNGGIAKYNRDLLAAVSVHPKVSTAMVLPRSKGLNTDFDSKPLNLYYDTRGTGGKWRYVKELVARLYACPRFDIVLCGHVNLLPVAYLAAKFTRAPLWCVLHGIEAWQPHTNWIVNHVIRRLDGFIAVSNTTIERFIAWSGASRDAGYLLPNSYDPSAFSPGIKNEVLLEKYGLQNKTMLMTLGRLSAAEQYKGFDEALECLPSLIQKIPGLAYLIVGDGDDLNRLKQKAQRLGIEDFVIFTGFIAEREKADHYRLADVYVMPGRGEGFGIVYLEAMACGIPAIGSKVDGSRDALRDGQLGILVDPSNPQELENAILQALAQKTRQPPPGLEYFNLYSFRQRAFQFLDHAVQDEK